MERWGDVLRVLDDQADHVGTLLLLVVLPRFED
jgi:hypothetical protein